LDVAVQATDYPNAARTSHEDLQRKRTHNFAEGEPITLVLTVDRDLGERRFAQRFLVVPW
jgi:hypothetical protein